jgi:short-subunit dehydrogenase
MYPRIPLRGAIVAITGGARGIGKATADAFAAHGARVFVGDLDGADHKLDVTSPDSFSDFLGSCGPVDILVNNAGVMPVGGFLDEPPEVGRTTMDVNLWGPVHGMRLVLPGMIERGRGHVVNIASYAGKAPIPGLGLYCASKHAVVGLSAVVRSEVAAHGVSVSAVLPSAVRTELSSGLPLGKGLPTVEPEAIAQAVVHSVRTRRGEIAVPAWMAGYELLAALTPEPVMRLARRLLRADRALTSVDEVARAEYQARVAKQVKR